jgi:flagellar basal body-associated protein FliL
MDGTSAFASILNVFGLTLAGVIVGGFIEPTLRPPEMQVHTSEGVFRIRASLVGSPLPSERGPARYLALDPPFIFTMSDDQERRYLELHISVRARSEEAIEAAQNHLPAVRGALQDTLYGRDYHSFESREGKEALRVECLTAVQRILAKETGASAVDDLYFTDLLFQ